MLAVSGSNSSSSNSHDGVGEAHFGAPADDLHDEIGVVVGSWHGCLLTASGLGGTYAASVLRW